MSQFGMRNSEFKNSKIKILFLFRNPHSTFRIRRYYANYINRISF